MLLINCKINLLLTWCGNIGNKRYKILCFSINYGNSRQNKIIITIKMRI